MIEPDGAPRPGLTIGVLGPLIVHRGEPRVLLGGRREAAVLVALVLARGRVLSADALADAVWPDSKPAQPQPSLQAHVSHLRKRLDPLGAPGLRTKTIERVGPGYVLRLPDLAVDAWRFESLVNGSDGSSDADRVTTLTQALALWRGEALAGFADEDWAKPTAARWTELQSVARERLYATRLDRGESPFLVPELETFVAQSPLREERWRLLVLALYRAHRQGDALAALRRVRELLADELGVDPGPALRSLEAEVLAQSTSLEPVTVRPVPPLETLQSLGKNDHGIVERDRELSSLQEAVHGAAEGDGRVVLIEGPAGIGKTRLLREVRSHAGRATVLAARGSQLEREYGFGVVRQLLEPVVAAADQHAVFAGAAGAARSVFQAHVETGGSPDTTFGVLHGLYWLTAHLATASPIVITVDDIQWCDVGSLRYLGFLAHRLEGLPVALVVTLRTGEHHDNEDLLAEIISEANVLVVAPRPLSALGVHELVEERLGDDPDEAFVAACRRTTGGNPLLLRQLLRALESDGIRPTASNVDTVRAIGSRAVSSLVLRRFARMPAESRTVARAIAVLGDGSTLPLLVELTGLPSTAVAAAIGSLARAEVLRHDYPLDFVHPLVRDAVYGDIPLVKRELQHEQAAGLLSDIGAAAEMIAAHLLKSPPRGDRQTVQTLLTAAANSVTQGAPDGAVTYLKRALAEPPAPALEPGLYLQLGAVETLTDVPTALVHLTTALERLTDIRERAHAAVMLGRVEIFAGSRGDSRATAEAIIDQLGAEHDDERQWLQSISRISTHMHALGAPVGAVPEIVGEGPGAHSLAATLSWEITLAGADRARAVELATFALAGEVLDNVDQGFSGVVARNVLENAEAAPVRQWDDALAKALRKGSLFAVLGAQVWGGYAHWRRGNLDESYEWLRNCTEQNDLWGARQIGQTYADAFMIDVLLDRGDLAGAQRLSDSEPAHWKLIGEGRALVQTARARLHFERGLLDDALVALEEVADLSPGIENPSWRSWQTDRAAVLAAAGRRAEALELLGTELRYARRWGTTRGIGRILRIRGSTLRRDGVEELREAVAVLQQGAARLELAKAQEALASTLASANGPQPAEAVEALRSAYLLAADCGAASLQARIANKLAVRGLEVPIPPPRTSLTTTEQRIVEMSLDGAFDREIAQALFLTTPTVRQVLEGVRGRLGVTSAQQLRMAVTAR